MSPSVNTFKSRLDKYWTGRGREDREGERRKRRGPLRVVSHPTFEIPKNPGLLPKHRETDMKYCYLLHIHLTYDITQLVSSKHDILYHMKCIKVPALRTNDYQFTTSASMYLKQPILTTKYTHDPVARSHKYI